MHDDACLSVKEVSSRKGTHPGIHDLSIFQAARSAFYKHRGKKIFEIRKWMLCQIDSKWIGSRFSGDLPFDHYSVTDLQAALPSNFHRKLL